MLNKRILSLHWQLPEELECLLLVRDPVHGGEAGDEVYIVLQGLGDLRPLVSLPQVKGSEVKAALHLVWALALVKVQTGLVNTTLFKAIFVIKDQCKKSEFLNN